MVDARARPNQAVKRRFPLYFRAATFVVNNAGLEIHAKAAAANGDVSGRFQDLHFGRTVGASLFLGGFERSQFRFYVRHGAEREGRSVAAPENAVKMGRDGCVRGQRGAAPTENRRAAVARGRTGLDAILAEERDAGVLPVLKVVDCHTSIHDLAIGTPRRAALFAQRFAFEWEGDFADDVELIVYHQAVDAGGRQITEIGRGRERRRIRPAVTGHEGAVAEAARPATRARPAC